MTRNYREIAGQYSAISEGSTPAPWLAIPFGRAHKSTRIRRTARSGLQQTMAAVTHQLNNAPESLPLPTGVRIPAETEQVYRP